MQMAMETRITQVSQLVSWLSPAKVCFNATPSPLHPMTDSEPIVPVIVIYTRGLDVPCLGLTTNMRTTASTATNTA